MTAITRRDALTGAAAVAVTGAVPIAAISLTDGREGDSALLALADHWHQAYEKSKEADLFDEANPMADDEYFARGYGEVTSEFWEVHEDMGESQPKTIAGVVAMLGCVQRVAADRALKRAGERAPVSVFFVHTDRLQKNAYAALKRLDGEARS